MFLVVWKSSRKVEEMAKDFTLAKYGLKMKKDQESTKCISWIYKYRRRKDK